jgi:DNA-binding transcriptional regulator of glucitol operon
LTVEEKEKQLKDQAIKIIVKEKDEKINQLVLNKNAEVFTGAALMRKVQESEKDISIKEKEIISRENTILEKDLIISNEQMKIDEKDHRINELAIENENLKQQLKKALKEKQSLEKALAEKNN